MVRKWHIRTSWVIHLFALLHAAVALCCRLAGVEDELLLTILTMSMALVICIRKGLTIDFSAASIIVVNIIGYFLGTYGALVISRFFSSPLVSHAISTALTTEILGWSLLALTKIFRIKGKRKRQETDSSHYMSWLLLAMCGIFFLRLAIVFIFSGGTFNEGKIFDTSSQVFSNSLALTTLICLNILYIRYAKRIENNLQIIGKALMLIAFILIAALLETLLVWVGLQSEGWDEFLNEFPLLYITSLLAQITVYCVVFMVNYALSARSNMKEEREKANMAQYRYVKLKHQVNPHFLFNSLNILDCLICEEKTEQASAYTHKLAGIYRYMLKSEEDVIVPLRDELVFVGLYVDLLKERFPVGLNVQIEAKEEQMARCVLPCSLQLLIENATKHNAVSEDNPLNIRIEVSDNSIKVTNNLIPKVSKVPSTGLGLKYIRQMYLDLSGKQIKVEKTEKIYRVTLPLI